MTAVQKPKKKINKICFSISFCLLSIVIIELITRVWILQKRTIRILDAILIMGLGGWSREKYTHKVKYANGIMRNCKGKGNKGNKGYCSSPCDIIHYAHRRLEYTYGNRRGSGGLISFKSYFIIYWKTSLRHSCLIRFLA